SVGGPAAHPVQLDALTRAQTEIGRSERRGDATETSAQPSERHGAVTAGATEVAASIPRGGSAPRPAGEARRGPHPRLAAPETAAWAHTDRRRLRVGTHRRGSAPQGGCSSIGAMRRILAAGMFALVACGPPLPPPHPIGAPGNPEDELVCKDEATT